jgi:hypothetical protein
MKQRNTFMFLLLAFILLANTAFAEVVIDSINYKIGLGDFSGEPSSIVKMPIKLKNTSIIGAFYFRIEYDTSLLELIEIGPGGGTTIYDSLELVDRGWNTIVIDSLDGIPPWDTLFNTFAFHDPGDDTINTEALFVSFMNFSWIGNPNIPINTGDPSTILDLLFRVNSNAVPGQTAEIHVKDYVGPYLEYRCVQLADTTGDTVIYPGEGPLFATCLFIVDSVYCGDANDDGMVNIFDIAYIISYLYIDGPPPDPMERADVNSDGTVNIFDITYLITFLYQDGPPPDCPPEAVDSVILPLTIGNQWITNVIEYNENGQVVDEYTGTGIVVGDTVINSWNWYFLESDTGMTTDTSSWTNKTDGAWARTDSTGEPETLMLKYPAIAGESYPVYDVTVTVESIDASVTVPAGTFTCYYYRMHIPIFGTIGRVWAAPNIGLIRAEEYGLTLFGTYLAKEIELESYNLVGR